MIDRLKEFIVRLTGSGMVKSAAVLWIGMMAANISNYLFHLLMGRFLGPVNYGVLASLVSVLYIILVPQTTIQTVSAKFTAEALADGDFGRMRSLAVQLNQRLLLAGLILFAGGLLISGQVSSFLNIPSVVPVVLLCFIFLTGYAMPVNRGVMQGNQEFVPLSVNLSLETALKLIVGFALVYLGFTVNGAIGGIVTGSIVAYFASFIPVRFLLAKPKGSKVELLKVLKYTVPVFVSYLCLTLYYSVDVILAKHFLSGVQAGLYSGLSILGKIVVFACLAIIGVMFPIVAALYRQDKEHRHYLVYTLLLVGAISGAIVLAYFIAPNLLIHILFGAKYAPVARYLGVFSLGMLLLALANVLANYYLAIHKTGFVYFLVVMTLVQAALLWFFHSTIMDFVVIMVATMLVLVIGLALYYAVAMRKPVTEESVPVAPVNPEI